MLVADLQEQTRQHVLAAIKSRQITQRALGERVGIRQAHISNFVRGRRRLSLDGMDAILNALGLDVKSLIAISEHTTSSQNGCSTTLESVPLVRHEAAMNPAFGKDEILAELGYAKSLVRPFSVEPTHARALWIRFIAIRADAALAAPMYPRFEKGSVLLVDRYCCSLSGQPNLYLVRKGREVMVRWAEMMDNLLCLRPDRSEYPLDFIPVARKKPLTSCIVGRVVHIATEFDNPVPMRLSVLNPPAAKLAQSRLCLPKPASPISPALVQPTLSAF
jgi:transcriptional regulator with XRE-family HTH domain